MRFSASCELDIDAEVVGVELELVAGNESAILGDVERQRGDGAIDRKAPVPVVVGPPLEGDHDDLPTHDMRNNARRVPADKHYLASAALQGQTAKSRPWAREDGMLAAATPMSGPYNAAVDLLGRNLGARADKTAFIDADGRHSYAEVAERAERCGAALTGLGLIPGDRVALVLLDGVDFVTCFFGAIRSGLVPIPLNTLFPAEDLAYILSDSRAGAAVVSDPLAAVLDEAIAIAGWSGQVVVSGQSGPGRWRGCWRTRRPAPRRTTAGRRTSPSGSTRPGRPADRRGRCTGIAAWR